MLEGGRPSLQIAFYLLPQASQELATSSPSLWDCRGLQHCLLHPMFQRRFELLEMQNRTVGLEFFVCFCFVFFLPDKVTLA